MALRAYASWRAAIKARQLAEGLFISITFRFRHNLSRTTSIFCIVQAEEDIMNFKTGLVAASLFGALAATSAASAMPIAPAPATPQISGIEQVRMVCNAWGRCWWRPNYYGYYGPRPYYGPRYYGPRYYGPRYGYYGYRRW